MKLNYEVVASRFSLDTWNAEAIDVEGDGKIYLAMFSGPQAHRRAIEYCEWMNSRPGPPSGSTEKGTQGGGDAFVPGEE